MKLQSNCIYDQTVIRVVRFLAVGTVVIYRTVRY